MVNVFATWVGEPCKEPKPLGSNNNQDRLPVFPDVTGLREIARKVGNPGVKFHFCCLAKYAHKYKPCFPPKVTIIPIEEQFEKTRRPLRRRTAPTGDLSEDVEYIIRQTIGYGGNEEFQKKHLAFVKDLWSLYCVWKFGGYHLDAGCFPGNGNVKFPDCLTLGIVESTEQGRKQRYNYKVTPRRFKKFPVVFYDSSVTTLKGQGIGLNIAQSGPSVLKQFFDVWAIRGPEGHESVRIALETYVNLWFAVHEGDLSEENYLKAMRATIVSACMTGISQSESGWVNKSTLMPALGPTLKEPSIRKYNYKSHR
ncbi:MAG: hypothetical protein MI863_22960 [Desulfobacterales bacterium]|nr:hypothetical protein [Desulfobacterales bacterium]